MAEGLTVVSVSVMLLKAKITLVETVDFQIKTFPDFRNISQGSCGKKTNVVECIFFAKTSPSECLNVATAK